MLIEKQSELATVVSNLLCRYSMGRGVCPLTDSLNPIHLTNSPGMINHSGVAMKVEEMKHRLRLRWRWVLGRGDNRWGKCNPKDRVCKGRFNLPAALGISLDQHGMFRGEGDELAAIEAVKALRGGMVNMVREVTRVDPGCSR
jgi:hypothetical protein